MTEKKTQTILKLKQSVPYDTLAILERIFFRSYSTKPLPETRKLRHLRKEEIVVTPIDMANKALDFANHIRHRQNNEHPYRLKE